jgi:hypothetical protein
VTNPVLLIKGVFGFGMGWNGMEPFHSTRMEPFHSCVRFGQKIVMEPFHSCVRFWNGGENGMERFRAGRPFLCSVEKWNGMERFLNLINYSKLN